MSNDEILLESLAAIQKLVKDELADETRNDEISKEIREEYEDVLELLGYLIPKISGIESLYQELEEDEFEFILECLETYQENFIIDGTNPQKLKEDEEKYSLISDMLFELYDDDEEDEPDEGNAPEE
ncbi:MAG: hypothetical protein II821_08035 [Treponema sp.]|nr:hypothetical protein [Treponema sp.]